MKRTVALKRNCCSLPDSKAQSSPGAKGTSRASPAPSAQGRPRLQAPVAPPWAARALGHGRHAGTALRGRLSNTEKAKHTREARLLALEPGLTPRTRWAAAAARAGAARRCRAPAGWTAATAARCWTATSTVRFLVQVKSSFQLILLFVPSGLPLLLSLHTSNGFSLDPAKSERTVTARERRASFSPAPGLAAPAATAVSWKNKALIPKHVWRNQPLSTNHPALLWRGPDTKSFVCSARVTSVTWRPRMRTMSQLCRDLGNGSVVHSPSHWGLWEPNQHKSFYSIRSKNPTALTEAEQHAKDGVPDPLRKSWLE